jgi:hypothetical protein
MTSGGAQPPDGPVDIERKPTAREEANFFDEEERRSRRIKNESDAQDMRERIRYADHAYGITQAWVGFLMVLTFAQLCLRAIKMGLEPAEFIAVFTTSTASVFGFWLLVGQYLFRSPGAEKKSDAKKKKT